MGVRDSVSNELENMVGGKITIYTNGGVEGNDVKFTEDDFKLVKEKVAHVKGAKSLGADIFPKMSAMRQIWSVLSMRAVRECCLALRMWWA